MNAIKYFWILSVLGFLAALLYTYVSYDSPILVFRENVNAPPYSFEKSAFFYGGLALIVLCNTLILTLSALLPKMRPPFLPVPYASFWVQHPHSRKIMTKYLKGWIKGIGILLNACLLLEIGTIIDLNDADFMFSPFIWLNVIGALLVLWILLFFYLFIGLRQPIIDYLKTE
jgi:hypothetical protein